MAVGAYPFHSTLDLALEPSAARWARLHAQDVLRSWEIPRGPADDALLVISELVTNAVRHASPVAPSAAGGVNSSARACALALQRMPDHLLISVYDQDRRPPVLKGATEDGESGRGLHLVAELSAEWGYAFPHSPVGKAVWVKVSTDEGPDRETRGVFDPGRSASGQARSWLRRHAPRTENLRAAVAMSP